MKQVYFILILCLLFVACSKQEEQLYIDFDKIERNVDVTEVLQRDTLRILDIGNSYSVDCTNMLEGIVKKSGMNTSSLCYYMLYRPAASFKTWMDCVYGNDNEKYECTKVVGDLQLPVPTGQFEKYDSEPVNEILEQQWDLIILHQVSQHSTSYASWNKASNSGYLFPLLMLLMEKQPEAAFAFYLIHSYDGSYSGNTEKSSYLRWRKITTAIDELRNDYHCFQLIIPYGTAIQSIRETTYNGKGDLTRDGTHLGYGLARYTAACTLYQALFYPRSHISVVGNKYRYQCGEYELQATKNKESCVDVDDASAFVAQIAAQKACQDYSTVFNPQRP